MVSNYDLAQIALSLYVAATLGLSGSASWDFGSCQYSGRCTMKEFLFSPYLDINIPTTAISQPTKSANVAPQLLVESPAGAIPQDMKALTLAFATGECGNERWGGRHSKEIVGSTIKSLRRAGIAYVISTGGAQGVFNCSTDEGMAQFIARNRRG